MNENIVIRLLCEEVQRLTWKAEYEKDRADRAEKELAEARKTIVDLDF